MVHWALWWKRNQKCWHDINPSNVEVLWRAREALQERCSARQQHNSTIQEQNASTTCMWSKHPIGSLKCNVVSVCYVNDNVYCVATCFCDNQRQFMRAYSKRFDGALNIPEAEAVRMKEAMR
jgi:hypothetical protein